VGPSFSEKDHQTKKILEKTVRLKKVKIYLSSVGLIRQTGAERTSRGMQRGAHRKRILQEHLSRRRRRNEKCLSGDCDGQDSAAGGSVYDLSLGGGNFARFGERLTRGEKFRKRGIHEERES